MKYINECKKKHKIQVYDPDRGGSDRQLGAVD